MGYAGPLDILKIINHRAGIVQLVEPPVKCVHAVGSQGLAGLGHGMSLLLEFREQGLAEKGGAEALNKVVQQVRPALLVGLVGYEVLQQQHFVYGGGHLRRHYGIIVVGESLGMVGLI